MSPLVLLWNDGTISDRVCHIWLYLHQTIYSSVLTSVLRSPIAYHYLGRILIRHYDCGNRESWSKGVWIIRLKRLSHHTGVEMRLLSVLWFGPWLFLLWKICVLIGVRIFPACLFKRECNCHCFVLSHHYVRASLHSCVSEERRWSSHFLLLVCLQVVERSVSEIVRLKDMLGLVARVGEVLLGFHIFLIFPLQIKLLLILRK